MFVWMNQIYLTVYIHFGSRRSNIWSMEGQSVTSESPSEGEYIEVEVEESPPELGEVAVVVVESNLPRSRGPPGAPRVGTNYNWPGLLKKAAPGYKSLPGIKDHDLQVARDLQKERESKKEEEDLQGGEASELIPQDNQARSSSSSFGSPDFGESFPSTIFRSQAAPNSQGSASGVWISSTQKPDRSSTQKRGI